MSVTITEGRLTPTDQRTLTAQTLFDELAKKYDMCSSWAVWNPAKPADTRIIAEHLTCLKSSVVMIGLNVSRQIGDRWQNFHGSDHARKLMFAFNDSPYRGAYMTDIIKDEIETSAEKVLDRIEDGSIDLQRHISAFRDEMLDVGVHKHSLFILFGQRVSQLFKRHLAGTYPNHVSCSHYSSRGSDAEWVDEAWSKLEARYEATKSVFDTLEFVRNDSMRDRLQKLRDKQNQRNGSPRQLASR
jgi:hypothetical protein